jgi:hypothetical protein
LNTRRSRGRGKQRHGRESSAGLERLMGTKNKGGKNIKKTAARDMKQKRLDKKAKKDSTRQKHSGIV